MTSTKGIVERLREFAAGQVHGFCVALAPCEMRAETIHMKDDQVGALLEEIEHCELARALLAEATPEAVRKADAGVDTYAALVALDGAAGSHNIRTHDGWNATAPCLEIPAEVRRQVDDARRKVEGR